MFRLVSEAQRINLAHLFDPLLAIHTSMVTVTRNEILTALNKPEDFILAISQIENGQGKLLYIRQPFQLEPEFSVESVNYKLQELLQRGESPV